MVHRRLRLARLLLAACLGFLVVCVGVASAAQANPTFQRTTTVTAVAGAGLLQAECFGPDVVCDAADGVGEALNDTAETIEDVAPGVDVLGALPGVPGNGIPGVPGLPGLPGLPGVPDPGDLLGGGGLPGVAGAGGLADLGSVIAKGAADAWTAAMMMVWASGLFIIKIVLIFSEMFLTPDLRGGGPGRSVYEYTLWMAGALVVLLSLVQLGAAVFQREGKGVARALIGAGQFVVVCACWFGFCALVVKACGALTHALMSALLGVNSWPEWDPLSGLSTQAITDGAVATVLAILGIFLWLAAVGHILVYLARGASLLLLTATGPLAASGLVSESTKAWFWKSLRWFLAASFTPVVMVLVLGIGVQMATGVAVHLADGAQKSIGTALPTVMLVLVSVVAPLSLFKLLAFVDPGTPSGSSFRQGMGAVGGVQGLLAGGGSTAGGTGSAAAASAEPSGRSEGESSAESATGGRFTKAGQGLVGSLGPVGAGVAAGMGMVTAMGAKATGLMSDETNQAGVGNHTYGPDFSSMGSNSTRSGGANGGARPFGGGGEDGDDDGSHDGGQPGDGQPAPPPPTAPLPQPGITPGGAAPAASGPGEQGGSAETTASPKPGAGGTGTGAGAAGGAAGGAGTAAAAVPPVA